ncbi:MAG: amino acid ABC transporter permease [Propionibacteriaceae bacterium]|nr:amino acid ABC transporter permease [Propionibacteriaceae bacterium]
MAFDLRPTVRQRITRLTSYVVFVAIVVVLALIANWPSLATNFADLKVAKTLWPDILLTAGNTIWYTVICFVLGLVLAVLFALMKMSKGPFGWFATAYIELFRGLPALLTIIFMAFAFPIAFPGLKLPGGALSGGLVALVIVTSAYTAEIIRAGVEAVPKGQTEAARSLGMGNLRTTFTVILPQAFRIVIPPLTNEFVTLLKDTSLLYMAGMTIMQRELTTFAKAKMSENFNSTPLIAVALMYLIITIPLTYLVGRLEKSMAAKK